MKFFLPLILLALSSVNAFGVIDELQTSHYCAPNKDGYSLNLTKVYSRDRSLVGNSSKGYFAYVTMQRKGRTVLEANFQLKETLSYKEIGGDLFYTFWNASFQENGHSNIEPGQVLNILALSHYPDVVTIIATPPDAKEPITFTNCMSR